MTSREPAATSASTDWVTLDDLPQGALFETQRGTLAVKSEYRYPTGQWECVLLASGEYAHFARGNAEPVRAIDIQSLTDELARAREQIVASRNCAQHPFFSGGCPCDCHAPGEAPRQDG